MLKTRVSLATLPFLIALAFGQAVPTITNVTNAAIPGMDYPPNSVALRPGSMATVFGMNLASYTASAQPPWPKRLSGVEIHLIEDSCYELSCELVADLIYISATQLNFVVPNVPLWAGPNTAHVWKTRIALIKDGQRYDDRTRMLGGPGRVYIDAVYGYSDQAVFSVGFDCLYSFSVSDPGACGVSWINGQHRVMVGAVTDAQSGRLITAQNPAYQGQVLTLWMTGLTGNPWFSNPASFCFNVAQYEKDLPSGVGWCSGSDSPVMKGLWSGKSPEFPGLDQANVVFPVCTNEKKAGGERRLDVYLRFSGNATVSQFSTGGATVRMYVPFIIRPGDPDCDWSRKNTTTTLQILGSIIVSNAGKPVTFLATVEPSYASGTVTFFDGMATLGTKALGAPPVYGPGHAELSISTLAVGDHSIVAVYNGDNNFEKSSSPPVRITVK